MKSLRSRPLRAVSLVLMFGAVMLAGCTTIPYNEQVRLNGQSAVAMDVKQRVVFSQTKHVRTEKDGRVTKADFVVTCAEPSPDALTVLGIANALSFNAAPSQGAGAAKTISLSNSVSESGAFVGLRTQSIQILRDQMYRLCEGFAAGAMDDAEFKAMQRRFQITVMGLIAIEQLTGPVMAGQAMLLSSAQSQAGAGANDSAVSAAQTAVDQQRQKVTTAEQAVNSKQLTVDNDLRAIVDNNDKIAEAGKAGDSDTAKTLRESGKTLDKQLQTDKVEVDNARLQLNQEREALQRAELALTAAQSRSSAASSGSGMLQAVARTSGVATEALAKAVREIVADVNASYIRDECVELLSRMSFGARPFDKLKTTKDDEIVERGEALNVLAASRASCVNVVAGAVAERQRELDLRVAEANRRLEEVRLERVRLEVGNQSSAESGKGPVNTPAPKGGGRKDRKANDKSPSAGSNASMVEKKEEVRASAMPASGTVPSLSAAKAKGG